MTALYPELLKAEDFNGKADFNVEVSYNKVGKIIVELYIVFDEDSDFTLSLVLEKGGELVADRE